MPFSPGIKIAKTQSKFLSPQEKQDKNIVEDYAVLCMLFERASSQPACIGNMLTIFRLDWCLSEERFSWTKFSYYLRNNLWWSIGNKWIAEPVSRHCLITMLSGKLRKGTKHCAVAAAAASRSSYPRVSITSTKSRGYAQETPIQDSKPPIALFGLDGTYASALVHILFLSIPNSMTRSHF